MRADRRGGQQHLGAGEHVDPGAEQAEALELELEAEVEQQEHDAELAEQADRLELVRPGRGRTGPTAMPPIRKPSTVPSRSRWNSAANATKTSRTIRVSCTRQPPGFARAPRNNLRDTV